MRSLACGVLTGLLLSGAVSAEPQKRVTRSFVGAELREVLQTLAGDMNRQIYISPKANGRVTLDLVAVPVEQAFRRALDQDDAGCDYLILDGPKTRTIVVAPSESLQEITHPSACLLPSKRIPILVKTRDFSLRDIDPVKVIDFLKGQYPDVEFTAKARGFVARGESEDLVQIERELQHLDRPTEPQPARISEAFTVRYQDAESLCAQLNALVPDALLAVDGQVIVVEGSPGVLAQVHDILAELDLPALSR